MQSIDTQGIANTVKESIQSTVSAKGNNKALALVEGVLIALGVKETSDLMKGKKTENGEQKDLDVPEGT